MTIHAKLEGHCASCAGPIRIGDVISPATELGPYDRRWFCTRCTERRALVLQEYVVDVDASIPDYPPAEWSATNRGENHE